MKITPKGEVSLTPAQATLDYLQRGTQIIPADETERILSQMGMYRYPIIPVAQKQPSNADVVDAVKNQTKSIVKAINKQGAGGQSRTENINWQLYAKHKTNYLC